MQTIEESRTTDTSTTASTVTDEVAIGDDSSAKSVPSTVGLVTSPSANTTLTTRPVRRPKQRPFIFWRVWWFEVRDFFRSAWALLALLVLVVAHVLLYNQRPTQSHFFSVQYASILLLAVVVSAALFSRANRLETYAILARPISRGAFTAVLILVAGTLSVLGHLLSTLAVVVRYGPWLDPGAHLFDWLDLPSFGLGSLPVVAGALAGHVFRQPQLPCRAAQARAPATSPDRRSGGWCSQVRHRRRTRHRLCALAGRARRLCCTPHRAGAPRILRP